MEAGEAVSAGLRVVDLWAAGRLLTVDDNTAYLASLCHHMRSEADRVRGGALPPRPWPGLAPHEVFARLEADQTELREQHWIMRWSEITDGVSVYAWLEDELVIAFAYWRPTHPEPEDLGKVFVARLSSEQFANTVQRAADWLARHEA